MTIVDRLFERDGHTRFLFKKKRECETQDQKAEVEWEIHAWWREWKEMYRD